MRYAAVVGGTVIGLAGAACNAVFGLDEVRLDTSVGGAGQAGGNSDPGGSVATGGVGDAGGKTSGTAGTDAHAGKTTSSAGGSVGEGAGGGGAGTSGSASPQGGSAGTALSGMAGVGATVSEGGAAGGGSGPGGSAGRGGADGTGLSGAGGSTGCARELTRNGDFEMARASWSEAPLGTQLVRRSDDPEVQVHGITPQTGAYLLRLGAPSTDTYVVHYAEQSVNIPSNAEEITLSGYLQIRTEEPLDDVYDVGYVVLFFESQPLMPFFRSPDWTNLTQAMTWTRFSFPVDARAIAGTEIVFRIVADLDTGTPTYFYWDTVSVTVTRCSP